MLKRSNQIQTRRDSSKTNPMKRGGSIKRRPIKRRGPISIKWQDFRKLQALKDRDEENLIKCEDHKMGLPACGIAKESQHMDLHHIKGRNEAPDLYFKRSNLVWLTRECHREAHNQR